jgi:hypothetical protein
MSISNQTVKQVYQGTGVLTTFAIPYAFIPSDVSNETKVYLMSTVGALTLQAEGALQDYTLDPAYDAVANPAGPSNVIFNTAPAANQKILITRELPITQIVSYINSGKFLAQSHELGMDRMIMIIQQINDAVTRASQIGIFDQIRGFDNTIPVMPAYPATLRTNDDQTAWQWVPLEEGGDTGSVPLGGLTGAALVKSTDNDFEMEWDDFIVDGYSSRFGAIFTSAGLRDTIDKIIAITYTAPAISLSAAGSGTVREKGTAVTSVLLTATITKRSDPIAAVRFYKDGSLIHTAASPNPAGGIETYTWTGSFTDNSSFTAQVDDDGSTGGPSTVTSSTQSFVFVYPYYVGAGAVGLSAANVALLTKLTIVSTATVNQTIAATGGQVFFFAYPASYGALTSILDVNGFETFPDWTLRTENITGLDGNVVSYRIYEFENPVTAGSYYYSFRR